MFKKKSLVLMGVGSGREKAVLTLENEGELITGRVRLYNFSKVPEGILSLGFYENGKVRKCGLVLTSSMLYSFKTEPDLADDFSCAVVNFVGATVKPLLFGSTEAKLSEVDVLTKIAGEALEKSKLEDVEAVLDEAGVEYDEALQQEIDEAIDKEMGTCTDEHVKAANLSGKDSEPDRCATCKYKRCFFGEEEKVPVEEKTRFIDDIKGQIDKLFETSPSESFLEEMIPSSKWVRVEFDGEGDYYILGLIYDDEGAIKYVCYGVPGIYQKTPPTQLSGYPVWFPLDSEKKESFGYWLTYQDAESGESIKAIVE